MNRALIGGIIYGITGELVHFLVKSIENIHGKRRWRNKPASQTFDALVSLLLDFIVYSAECPGDLGDPFDVVTDEHQIVACLQGKGGSLGASEIFLYCSHVHIVGDRATLELEFLSQNILHHHW